MTKLIIAITLLSLTGCASTLGLVGTLAGGMGRGITSQNYAQQRAPLPTTCVRMGNYVNCN